MTHRDTTPSHGTSPDRTAQELQESLAALADAVHAPPDAYRTARGEWLRRERRRRLVLTVLVAVVFAVAVLLGLWVLNRAPSDPGVVFSGTGAGAGSVLSARGVPLQR
ncbi:hypothetical protein [Streptomyces broussonetiae]|uniref:DUF3040 domain-containing protein n=1 Tax=Streptomyces broussonetiae TaxID=2686304 RepID=A0ABV5E2S2_9ACTN